MKRYLSGLAVAIAVACGAGMGVAVAEPDARWLPPHDTVVRVTGDAVDGFGLHHYDGTELEVPPQSDAHGQCLEHDARLDRVRCRVEIRTWYADLAELKTALRWANRPR